MGCAIIIYDIIPKIYQATTMSGLGKFVLDASDVRECGRGTKATILTKATVLTKATGCNVGTVSPPSGRVVGVTCPGVGRDVP